MNWQFLPMNWVYTELFEKGLLISHLGLLLTFLMTRWTFFSPIKHMDSTSIILNQTFFKEHRLLPLTLNAEEKSLDPTIVARILSICNLIGMLCARGLHH